ncbi:MAG TPA: methyl-accepting chemotaxis protein, partial [Steroidobacteraceae bacterium]|nr:methyl-accepting chemotaxis protein [Steroidobacteraceae bacterium]
ALMIGLGSYGLHGILKLNDNIHRAYVDNTVPTGQIMLVGLAQEELRRLLWKARALNDKAQGAALRKEVGVLKKAWQAYYPDGVASPRERALADRADAALEQFWSMVDQQIGMLESGDFQRAATFQQETLTPVARSLSGLIREIANLNIVMAKDYQDSSNARTGQTIWITCALLATGVLAALATGVYLLRAITVPLGRSVDIADRIAGGNLDQPVVVDVKGEFGLLLQAMRRMSEQLSGTVRGIKVSSESVRVASKEIAQGNLDLSARTEAQAASLEETAASMTELSQTVKLNADNALQANSLASNARDMADASNHAVQAMVETIGRISASSEKISDITSLIEGIAFQTNILALNAAVEAARAGEQGRGFAVVAGEVRALAQRSSAAAKEIKDLIDSSSAMVADGSKQASEVGDTMAQVIRAIKQVSDIVGEISAASAEQSQGIEQVHQAVSQIDSVTQQNAALVEESAAAAQALEQEAARMSETVSVFKLDGMQAPAIAAQRTMPRAAPRATRKTPTNTTTTTTASRPARSAAPAKPQLSHAAPAAATLAPAGDSPDGDDWQAF